MCAPFGGRILFAVVRTGGKQYKVAVGDEVLVEKLGSEPGETVEFGEVLVVANGEDVRIGAPVLEGASVRATVVSHDRARKIRIFKFKAKKRYRKRAGHRQNYTRVKIDEIVA